MCRQKLHRKLLLCISWPSANEFSAIFLLFARSSLNYPRSFQRFGRTLRRNFNWIRQQMKNIPIAESGHYLQWGSIGKSFTSCRIYMKCCTRICLNLPMIEVSLSLIGQVKIISPKIRFLHHIQPALRPKKQHEPRPYSKRELGVPRNTCVTCPSFFYKIGIPKNVLKMYIL